MNGKRPHKLGKTHTRGSTEMGKEKRVKLERKEGYLLM